MRRAAPSANVAATALLHDQRATAFRRSERREGFLEEYDGARTLPRLQWNLVRELEHVDASRREVRERGVPIRGRIAEAAECSLSHAANRQLRWNGRVFGVDEPREVEVERHRRDEPRPVLDAQHVVP